jgi:hypothetical protein
MAYIDAGSDNPVFYADEARHQMNQGNLPGALGLLNLARDRQCSDHYCEGTRRLIQEKMRHGS